MNQKEAKKSDEKLPKTRGRILEKLKKSQQ